MSPNAPRGYGLVEPLSNVPVVFCFCNFSMILTARIMNISATRARTGKTSKMCVTRKLTRAFHASSDLVERNLQDDFQLKILKMCESPACRLVTCIIIKKNTRTILYTHRQYFLDCQIIGDGRIPSIAPRPAIDGEAVFPLVILQLARVVSENVVGNTAGGRRQRWPQSRSGLLPVVWISGRSWSQH